MRLIAIDITQRAVLGDDSYHSWIFSVQDVDGYVYDTGLPTLFPNLALASWLTGRVYVAG